MVYTHIITNCYYMYHTRDLTIKPSSSFLAAIVCPPLIPGQNTVDVPTTPLKFLETYTYTCEPGYSTNDPLCVLCNADGEFSIDPPNCTGEYEFFTVYVAIIFELLTI